MDEIANKKVGPVSVIQLIAIIGGIIGVVALFLTWYTLDVVLISESYTRLDFITNEDWSNADFHKYMPVLAMVMALLGLIVSIMPMVKPGLIKSSAALLIIFGILGVVFSVLFYTWTIESFTIPGITIAFSVSDGAGIGIWLSIVGNALVLLCGLVDVFMSKKVTA